MARSRAPFYTIDVKIALGQINPTVGDFEGNAARIIEFARRARDGGAELVVFSELCVCGYPPRDLVEKPSFVQANCRAASEIAESTRGIAVICGLVTPAQSDTGKSVMNSAALLRDGRIEFLQSKMLLPTYDVFDEMRNFAPAKHQEVMPFGGRKLALTVCEDAWNDKHFWDRRLYGIDPVEMLMGAGGNFVINISASPFHIGKREFRTRMLAAIAREYKAPLVMVNQVGGNDQLVFDGSSLALGPDGRSGGAGQVVRGGPGLPRHRNSGRRPAPAGGGRGGQRLRRAGAGHARLRAQVRLRAGDRRAERGHRFGAHRLHRGGRAGRRRTSPASACRGRTPRAAPSTTPARSLPISASISRPCRSARCSTISARRCKPAFAGRPEDVTEENIQARIRGTLLMALSNKFGALVLTTGNKSELAVGYCTLYGDMVGGMAVISDVPKTLVYRLARYVNSRRPVIPQATLEKPPSAELRPNQTDQDTLPPYEVLDTILEDYIEDLKTPEQIAAERHYDLALVRKVARMVERSEYKRQQAAPGIKITEKAFGMGRRFPIAQKSDV